MKVYMSPSLDEMKNEESGIRRVIEAYHRYLPDFGIELVKEEDKADLTAVHAGTHAKTCHVAHTHGLYWTADYPDETLGWQYVANANVIGSCRLANVITVPSSWVAESFQRDMRRNPIVIGHGIDLDQWGKPIEQQGYVFWNKNRSADVCDPRPVKVLADRFGQQQFVTTFAPSGTPSNVRVIGTQAHSTMKGLVKGSSVYLATTKETFGIGILEAMASGVPVLGYAHGGVLDLIEHGVSGYLADPNNEDDLAEGLIYCLKHRKMLGDNAREMVKEWTWSKAVEKVAKAYRQALVTVESTVSIIIPCYNLSHKVDRAIESVINQTYEEIDEIVIVDDGSEDAGELQSIVSRYALADDRVRLIRQTNQGVAVARNTGIASTQSPLVACLDADDALAPRWVEACVEGMKQDRSIDLAYTGLLSINPDGSETVSPWPNEWDFDQQLKRRNQVPTACLFKRSVWERLGGYRQRYAPMGAGSEDAEFWTRIGAYGSKCQQVTAEPLFLYSHLQGRVSGNPNYREVDWLAWHPWVKDGQHPFASRATPKRFSHPVRQYDQPVVSVVIPVGPGHKDLLIDALDSLEAQTFRQWEAIVVWDIEKPEPSDAIYKAYPYIRSYHTEGHKGAGHARNLGARQARGDFLIFLDADDWLLPDCLSAMIEAWSAEPAIIYTDYMGKAVVDDVDKLAPDLQKRIYDRNPRTNETLIGYRSADFDCELAVRQPEKTGMAHMPYFVWCNVTALIPKVWHDEIDGFDESMSSWEDVDYHWRLARNGRCYTRIESELMVYRFHTGHRRQVGLHDHQSIVEYLRDKYEESEPMGCGCKGNGRVRPSVVRSTQVNPLARMTESVEAMASNMNDQDLIMVRYEHPNKGQHAVVGSMTKTKYGFRAGGDSFLVKKADIDAQPHLFKVIEHRPEAPKQTIAPPSAPRPIGQKISELPGVSQNIADMLEADGLVMTTDLSDLTADDLTKYKGIGKVTAETIIKAVNTVLA